VDKLVVGNKSDQADKRKISFDEGYELAKAYKLEFTEVSALSAENIGKAFELLARKVMKRLSTTQQPPARLPQRL
jgi:GTPase SAR1 family protein